MAAAQGRVIAVASGKGGAGKTSVAVNLAFALARMGRRVLLLDADFGLSNVDIALGIEPPVTLEDVLFGSASLAEAVVPAGPPGTVVDVVSGGSGVARLAELGVLERMRLAREFRALSGYDVLIADLAPGISRQVTSLCLAADEIVVVINPEAASVTDGYALVKVLAEQGLTRGPVLCVNRARSQSQARFVFSRFSEVARQHIRIDCRLGGVVPEDQAASKAAAMQVPLVAMAPRSPAGVAYRLLATRLDGLLTGPGGDSSRPSGPGEFMAAALDRLEGQEEARAAAPARSMPPANGRRPESLLAALAGALDKLAGETDAATRRALAGSARKVLGHLAAMVVGGPAPSPRPVPARKPAPAPAKPVAPPAAPAPPPRQRALVVSPKPHMRELLSELLADMGLSVDSRPVPPTAGEARSWRLAVLDLGEGGEALAGAEALHDTPVILLRQYLGRDRESLAVNGRQVSLINLPFRIETLRAEISRFMRG